MRSDQAKTIAIHEYLATVEGIRPTHTRLNGKEYWYHSPLRDGDKTPSFKVDTISNVWFDHGLSEGGKIIDLVCKLRNVTVSEALAILDRSGLYIGGLSSTRTNTTASPLFQAPVTAPSVLKNAAVEKENTVSGSLYTILETKPLAHASLLQYLDSRCIDRAIAHQYFTEVHFKHKDKLAQYFAIGWKNGKGFEVRNKYFKGFVGTGKTISLINTEHTSEWLVFEGFMDFLSYLTYLKTHKNITELNKGVVVLNSTALRKQFMAKVEALKPKSLYCFFDNDTAGRDTLEFVKMALPAQNIQDMSHLYTNHKDCNAWLCSL